jgi:hypothetical protein
MMPPSSAPDGQQVIIRSPGKHDILFGRGGAINSHRGNILFRRIVDEQKEVSLIYPSCHCYQERDFTILMSWLSMYPEELHEGTQK